MAISSTSALYISALYICFPIEKKNAAQTANLLSFERRYCNAV